MSGVGTFIWLTFFGVPCPLLLALLVALFDLVPTIGSTVAGIVVTAAVTWAPASAAGSA
jgi:predicted PurR-regulated permease PerM